VSGILFSVILPSYNRALKLPKAIDSVLAQSYTNFELIIVDDGSEDDTRKVVESYNDSRLVYLYQKNKGVCAARNQGIRISNSNYITFLDSDDYSDNDWLSNFYDLIQQDKSDIVFCDMNLHFPDGRTKLRRALFRYNEKVQNNNGMFMPGSFAIKSELIKSIGGFDENIKFGEFTDIDFTLQRMEISRAFTNKIGIHYHPAPDGGGKNQQNKVDAISYLLDKHKIHFKEDKNAKWLYLQNAAISYVRLKKLSLARKYFLKAFLVKPWRIQTLIRYFISLLPFLSNLIWNKSYRF
jgi:glycosyltransferase involved in cell wall biosynthesis